MSGNHKATPPKPKSDASRWTQKGTKDERRQRDHEMRQNAEIDDAAAKLQTFVDEEDGNQIHRVIETEGLPENIPYCIPNHSDFLIFSAAETYTEH